MKYAHKVQIKRCKVVTSFFPSYYKSETVFMFLEVMTMLSFDCVDFAMRYTNVLCGKLFFFALVNVILFETTSEGKTCSKNSAMKHFRLVLQ